MRISCPHVLTNHTLRLACARAGCRSSLSDMANLGMNVIMVIHQPRFSCFLLFDQVRALTRTAGDSTEPCCKAVCASQHRANGCFPAGCAGDVGKPRAASWLCEPP